MARRPREKSETGIYHVMVRGINHRIIFGDNEDFTKFYETIKSLQEKSGYVVYAYCLMNNPIHILLKEVEEDLGTVETDSYFLTVLRYIYQNPLKAGIVEDIASYRWSSYGEYIGDPGICDVGFVLNMFSAYKDKAVRLFEEFNLADNQDQCLDYEKDIRLNDNEAGYFIWSIAVVQRPTEIREFEKQKRDGVIKQCRDKGLSIRQIERITGVSFGMIRKI